MDPEQEEVCRRIMRGASQTASELNRAGEDGRILESRRRDMVHVRDEIQRNIDENGVEITRCAVSLVPTNRNRRSDVVIGGRAADCFRRLAEARARLIILERSLSVANERLGNMDNRIAENQRRIEQKQRVLDQFGEQRRQHGCR